MTPVLSVWKMVKWMIPGDYRRQGFFSVFNMFLLPFRKLCKALVRFITESFWPFYKLQPNRGSRFILQGTA